jgi:hypothetical protein
MAVENPDMPPSLDTRTGRNGGSNTFWIRGLVWQLQPTTRSLMNYEIRQLYGLQMIGRDLLANFRSE